MYVYVLLPSNSYRIHYNVAFSRYLPRFVECLLCAGPRAHILSELCPLLTRDPGQQGRSARRRTAAGQPPASESWFSHLVFHLGRVL